MMRRYVIQPLWYITLSALAVLLAAAGCAKIAKTSGVENRWRDHTLVFQKSVTTQQEVLDKLGPPSQIIALQGKTVFYYLFEETKGNILVLVIYNQANTNVSYDRAIFFFDKNEILEEYAFSNKDRN
jgi:outer membrane protein assembly factor BamE (lipoprotein component of BamABCDE complex)